MKLKDAEKVKVTIEYELEWDKGEFDDMSADDIVKKSEEECVTGSGSQDYGIEGWNGTGWESIEE